MAKCTYGTGAFLLLNTGSQYYSVRNGLISTVAWQIGDRIIYPVDGGASDNQIMMQLQTNIVNIPIEKSDTTESTVLGAAFLAGLAIGFWDSERCLRNIKTSSRRLLSKHGNQRVQFAD